MAAKCHGSLATIPEKREIRVFHLCPAFAIASVPQKPCLIQIDNERFRATQNERVEFELGASAPGRSTPPQLGA